MRLSDEFFCMMSHSTDKFMTGQGSLKVLVDRMSRGNQCKLYYKPFYTRSDFSDERYSPVFTPTVYSGQKMTMRLYLDQWNGWETLGIAPYIRTMSDKKEHLSGYIKLIENEWLTVEYDIPDTQGDLIDEIGIVIEGYSTQKAKSLGVIYVDSMDITGKAKYSIDFSKQKKELGTVTPFAVNHGAWDLEDGNLSLMRCEEAFAYAGNYYGKDYILKTSIVPINGESHLLQVRAQGAMRGYAVGFSEPGKVAFYKNSMGYEKIAEVLFKWNFNQKYEFTVQAKGEDIELFIDGQPIIEIKDADYQYGMFGCGSLSMGRTIFGNFEICEL